MKKCITRRMEGGHWLDWEEEKKAEVNALRSQAANEKLLGHTEEEEHLNQEADILEERNKANKMPKGIVVIVPDPNISGTIYAGTKSGLFRSRDGGKYWHTINIIESAYSFPIRSVAINPDNSKEIIFVAGRSLYKSINDGLTWAVTPLSSDRDASFVAYDPFDTQQIFVGASNIE